MLFLSALLSQATRSETLLQSDQLTRGKTNNGNAKTPEDKFSNSSYEELTIRHLSSRGNNLRKIDGNSVGKKVETIIDNAIKSQKLSSNNDDPKKSNEKSEEKESQKTEHDSPIMSQQLSSSGKDKKKGTEKSEKIKLQEAKQDTVINDLVTITFKQT